MKITKFEFDIIKHILNDWGVPNKLFLQLNELEITSRTFTGVGFFSNFFVPDVNKNLACIIKQKRLSGLFNVSCLRYGIEAILIVKDGYLKQLEVHTYGEDFPSSLGNITAVQDNSINSIHVAYPNDPI